SHLLLVKNPSYWKPGRPYLDRIVYKIVPDANALLNQLETGDIDTRVRLVNEQIEVVQKLSNVRVVATPSVTPWVVWMNHAVLSFIQQQWKQVGVDAKIRTVDVGQMWGRMLPQRQFEAAYSYTGRLPDPDMSTHYLSPELKPTTNFPGYANADVDKLLLAANAT